MTVATAREKKEERLLRAMGDEETVESIQVKPFLDPESPVDGTYIAGRPNKLIRRNQTRA